MTSCWPKLHTGSMLDLKSLGGHRQVFGKCESRPRCASPAPCPGCPPLKEGTLQAREGARPHAETTGFVTQYNFPVSLRISVYVRCHHHRQRIKHCTYVVFIFTPNKAPGDKLTIRSCVVRTATNFTTTQKTKSAPRQCFSEHRIAAKLKLLSDDTFLPPAVHMKRTAVTPTTARQEKLNQRHRFPQDRITCSVESPDR